jgi:hypothetical protein
VVRATSGTGAATGDRCRLLRIWAAMEASIERGLREAGPCRPLGSGDGRQRCTAR